MDIIDQIQQNQKRAADAFDTGAENIVIPYEANTRYTNHAFNRFLGNRDMQMKYCKNSVTSGLYRKWIEQLEEYELEQFIELCDNKINDNFTRRVTAPDWEQIQMYMVRKLMYDVELHRRRLGWSLAVKQNFFEDFANDMIVFRRRFEEAWNVYHDLKAKPGEEGLPY